MSRKAKTSGPRKGSTAHPKRGLTRHGALLLCLGLAVIAATFANPPPASAAVTGGGSGTAGGGTTQGGGFKQPPEPSDRTLCARANPAVWTFHQDGTYTATDGNSTVLYTGPTTVTVEFDDAWAGPDGTYGNRDCNQPVEATTTVTGSSGGGGVGAGAGGVCTSGPKKAKLMRTGTQTTIEWGGNIAGDGTCTVKGNTAGQDGTLTLPPLTLHYVGGQTRICDSPYPECKAPLYAIIGNYLVTAPGDGTLPNPGGSPPPHPEPTTNPSPPPGPSPQQVAPPLAPRTDVLTPNFGPRTGGTRVSISGSNLAGASRVDFGARPVTLHPCPNQSPGPPGCFTGSPAGNQIIVFAPEAPIAGPVNVTVTVPGSGTSNALQYTYQDPASGAGAVAAQRASAPETNTAPPPQQTIPSSGSRPPQLPIPPTGTGSSPATGLVSSVSVASAAPNAGPGATVALEAEREAEEPATAEGYLMVGRSQEDEKYWFAAALVMGAIVVCCSMASAASVLGRLHRQEEPRPAWEICR